jgi:beta-aspartyl-peptidase (threonine type)
MRFAMTRFATVLTLIVVAAVRADDEKDIRQVLGEQAVAWNKGDLVGFMKGYWNSKELTFVSGKDATRGWDETLERYKKRYQSEGKEMGKLTFSDVDVRILAPGVALVTGKWELKLAKETVGGRYSLVLRKFDAGWRIIHDHTSG